MTRLPFPLLIFFLITTPLCYAETEISGKEILDKAVLAERDDLTAEYIDYIVRHGLMSMPPFKPSNITDAELKALTDYLIR